jgi:hypothetical protein
VIGRAAGATDDAFAIVGMNVCSHAFVDFRDEF